MNSSKIWLSSPHMGGGEQKYINEAMDSNWVAPIGPNVNGFENDLEKFFGKNVSVASLSSGTAAIHLALILLGVKPKDEVICQSMTFSASANPIIYLGATPIFIDSELETWNMCPETLEIAIKDRIKKGVKPKAIIAVHLYGMPYKVDEIRAIANKYGIPILEDSAEALGSSYKNKKCGTLGDISILSFNGNKIITTSGGGALVTKTKELKERAIFLASQARDEAPHYQHSEIGYNYRMSNICAGIGRGQMEVLENHITKRREMHHFYSNIFSNNEAIQVFSEPNSNYYSNYWLTAILINPSHGNKKSREDVRIMLEEVNIESRPLWKPMHVQPVFSSMPYYGEQVSEKLFNTGLCLPSGSNLTEEEKQRIKKVLSCI
ncbi:DegT/DnrJ/EryC1/StrS family aminotransferase [Flavobacterium sp.]|uniref:DegT/DnrJ/EryC1/StrS family aminotransferase n=1 Tax=Flavobacterium sp. TaxID=239 RepID=UPI003BC6CBDB